MPAADVHQLNVRIPTHINDQLRVIAEVDGTSVSAVVIDAIEQHIAKKRASKKWQAKYEQWQDRQRQLLDSFNGGSP